MSNALKFLQKPLARGLIVGSIALLTVATVVTAATTIGTNITMTGSISGASSVSTTAVTLLNGETITNATDGVIKLNATSSFNGYATTTVDGVLLPTNRTAAPVACSATYTGGLIFNETTKMLCMCNGNAWIYATSSVAAACASF